jgi:hypothetical protein
LHVRKWFILNYLSAYWFLKFVILKELRANSSF